MVLSIFCIGSTLTLVNWSLVFTPVGVQCFDLHNHLFFQALVGCLLAEGKSLPGPSQEESFGVGLLPASPCKNRDSCPPKGADTSGHLGPFV